ncbi:LOW QUALITY PROTEIN: NADH dehydrogenase [ubiquinone] 1 beta subcomplex subunit 2, mitochondrial [Suncus etruscus]|uniref:LOW QUALITY PROTEIN: NADH dehydrogenase [ubiquinone] 1 beta subcomplex subunit 2, mitochondrial n=1 Tax=Suncus etruscus TaxID=109475 RepID=UPI002110A58D|nr:LOW QUALITY PROTEIN: NADH dehydrogenase [ubiquinone] 1 beta subcomplex subunit 2, mitochondrial [Suncus etruscus]
MSALSRAAPLLSPGGRLFKGLGEREAGGAGVRRAGGGPHIEPRYRQFPQLTRSQVIQAEFFSATMWFWILWRFWHDSDAVLGHFPYPDPSQWTDEELGILPDDED